MITNGFTYIAVLLLLAATLVTLEKNTGWKFFKFIPAVVLLYLLSMVLCTLGVWDMAETKPAYSALKNSMTYAMIFTMLLRCDIRKIIKLGPKMLLGFFTAAVTIMVGFVVAFLLMKGVIGSDAWMGLGALCGSWLGGSGNMVAVQAALDISEADMGYALVIDSIDYSLWVMFLLWAIQLAPKFNKWSKADTKLLDEVSSKLADDAKLNTKPVSFQSMILLIGVALTVSAVGQNVGKALNSSLPFLDKATWTVLFITVLGLIAAVSPLGKVAGSTEVSNLLLYTVGVMFLQKGDKNTKFSIKSVINVPIVATLIAVVIFIFEIPMPKLVDDVADTLSAATVPLSMMCVGLSLGSVSLKEALLQPRLYGISLVRLLICPLAVWLVLRIFITNPVILGTIVLLSACPSAIICTILGIQYGRDGVESSEAIFISTMLSMITIPLLISVLGL